MGVPVVTLVGQTAIGRGAYSQLANLSLPDLTAHTPREFIRIAADLAMDLPRLALLRSTLRERMQSSPLMDGRRFARNMEQSLREMWRKSCDAAASA
jgi:predicted O-linked N-acetylglucosamine transferase (SPINDLY family)